MTPTEALTEALDDVNILTDLYWLTEESAPNQRMTMAERIAPIAAAIIEALPEGCYLIVGSRTNASALYEAGEKQERERLRAKEWRDVVNEPPLMMGYPTGQLLTEFQRRLLADPDLTAPCCDCRIHVDGICKHHDRLDPTDPAANPLPSFGQQYTAKGGRVSDEVREALDPTDPAAGQE